MINTEPAQESTNRTITQPSKIFLKKKLPPETVKKLEKDWLAKNKEAIQKCNEHVEKHGIFGSKYRGF